jgi:hypothetical protein
MNFEQDLIVERPVQDAFLACDSAELQVRWVASLVGIERDDEQAWGTGSQFRQVHEESGMRRVLEGVLLDYQPNRRILMHLVHDDFDITTELQFEDLGQRSRIRLCSELEPKSLPLKMLQGTIAKVLAKRLEDDFTRLAAMLQAS